MDFHILHRKEKLGTDKHHNSKENLQDEIKPTIFAPNKSQ